MKRILQISIIAIALVATSQTAKAQSEVYFREGFNSGTFPGAITDAVPAKEGFLDSSGTWFTFGAYRTTGGSTNQCANQTVSHIRFGNLSTATTPGYTAADSSYLVTPVVNFGVSSISFYNSRAGRRFTIQKTTGTDPATASWVTVTLVPLTNAQCDLITVPINDASAKRIRILARGGTDSDIDSLIMTSFSPILPVTFAGISAAEVEGKIAINWKVATEENTARYAIERSTNGISFSEVGTVRAAKSGSYNWVDINPAAGAAFYRIKSVDFDGASNYTTVVKINLSKRNFDFVIAPNPIRGSLVNLQVSTLTKGIYGVSIFNSTGQQIFAKAVNHNGGSASYQLQLPGSVKAGVYNIQLKQGDIVLNKKLVVE